MTFSSAFIYQKLEALNEHTAELKRLLEETPDSEFFTDSGKLHIAERLTQLIVDGMIDINQHFIRELELEIPEDLRGTFGIMGAHGVLPAEFAEKIAPVAGVRNILVHQYEKLDKALFVKNLRAHFADFETYQRHVVAYMKRIEKQ
jgi:uncharacterized protein YutE (UPF0331/DUF86 family)